MSHSTGKKMYSDKVMKKQPEKKQYEEKREVDVEDMADEVFVGAMPSYSRHVVQKGSEEKEKESTVDEQSMQIDEKPLPTAVDDDKVVLPEKVGDCIVM